MQKPGDEHKIEQLNKDIYSRDYKSEIAPVRPPLSPESFDVGKGWKHTDSPLLNPLPAKTHTGSFFKIIIILAIIFFVVSAGFALYIFLSNWNTITADKVNVSFVGPISVAAGEELDFDLVVENYNQSTIENAEVFVDYPDGTKSSTDISQDISHVKESLGKIEAGTSVRKTMRSVLFGEQQDKKEIKVLFEYNVPGSSAIYKKEKTYEILINSAPISLSIKHVEEAVSGQDISFEVEVASNSSSPLSNILLRAEYPFGFSVGSVEPSATWNSNAWLIPSLKPGEKLSYKISGKIEGEQGDQRVFRFMIGDQSKSDEQDIAVAYLLKVEAITLNKPPLAVELSLNGSSDKEYSTNMDAVVRGSMLIRNNLLIPVVDVKAELKFSGTIFNALSPQSSDGFYRSIDQTIVWDKNTVSKLSTLGPGEETQVQFGFRTISAPKSGIIKNATMNVSATVSGTKISTTEPADLISTTVDKTLKNTSSVGVSASTVYSSGPFKNTGPIPLKANIPTTYTVILGVTSGANDISGTEVRGKIPVYVEWLGATSPESEQVTWSAENREFVWRVGNVDAGTGTVKPVREVAIQLQILPSTSQSGHAPALVTDIGVIAVDSFTRVRLNANGGSTFTETSTDSGAVTR